MWTGWFRRNKAVISPESNNNTIVQDCVVNNPVIITPEVNVIEVLGGMGKYEQIQNMAINFFNSAEKVHPLYPEFVAKFEPNLKRLISTPETADVLERYPRTIKGRCRIDYSKYPNMNKAETPWDYAYRTQTEVEMQTSAYKEYLGEIEDPFPILTYTEGMKTIIGPPEFPEPTEAVIKSGDISIPFLLRRLPHPEYKKLMLGNVSYDNGLDIRIVIDEETEENKVTFTRNDGIDLEIQLKREQLLRNIKETRKVQILVCDEELMEGDFETEELNSEFFVSAAYLEQYLSNLIVIEQEMNCHFDRKLGMINPEQFLTVAIMARSLKNSWYATRLNFDDEVRCDFDHIKGNLDKVDSESFAAEINLNQVTIHGICFAIEKYIIVYKGAKINNLSSVKKNILNKRKSILFTMKPLDGSESFIKYARFDGIKLSQ